MLSGMRSRPRPLTALVLVLTFVIAVGFPAAQTPGPSTAPSPANGKKALTVADYTKWKSIGSAELSPDGKWVSYVISSTNTLPAESKPVLHVMNLETKQKTEVADASGPSFSSDSQWIAYTVEPAPAGRGNRGANTGANVGSGSGANTGAGAAQTPAPGQTGMLGGGIDIDDTVLQGWNAFLDELGAILKGEKLVAHWRFRQGINLRRMFLEPRTFDASQNLLF